MPVLNALRLTFGYTLFALLLVSKVVIYLGLFAYTLYLLFTGNFIGLVLWMLFGLMITVFLLDLIRWPLVILVSVLLGESSTEKYRRESEGD